MTLTALRELPLLEGVDESELVRVAGRCRWVWHQPGEIIVRQGEANTDFFVVVRGQVEVQLEGEIPTR
ncbi:MAG TPA: cyclic nucleotide-binding domain-containing protein, partial [Symbiobacteriaceae bacterium]|nr:cyclic nucleotide-binding domain-containing protein [Symbiobacteriaceae bacterium]